MTRIFIADASSEERYALRLLINDLNMEFVGETDEWLAVQDKGPASRADIYILDWDLLPLQASVALGELRKTSPGVMIILISGHHDIRQQVLLSSKINMFISKSDPPERIADQLRIAASRVTAIPNQRGFS